MRLALYITFIMLCSAALLETYICDIKNDVYSCDLIEPEKQPVSEQEADTAIQALIEEYERANP